MDRIKRTSKRDIVIYLRKVGFSIGAEDYFLRIKIPKIAREIPAMDPIVKNLGRGHGREVSYSPRAPDIVRKYLLLEAAGHSSTSIKKMMRQNLESILFGDGTQEAYDSEQHIRLALADYEKKWSYITPEESKRILDLIRKMDLDALLLVIKEATKTMHDRMTEKIGAYHAQIELQKLEIEDLKKGP